MTMPSPFFVGKEYLHYFNLANESIRDRAHGDYVLVHAYTPSTGQSITFPPSAFRILHLERLATQDNTLLTAKGSYLRLGTQGHFLHDIKVYPTVSANPQGRATVVKPEFTQWEATRQIGGNREWPLWAGGVQRVDTEAAVVFMNNDAAVRYIPEQELIESNEGPDDDCGLPSLEKLVGGRGDRGLRATGSTITFGFQHNVRELVVDLDGLDGKRNFSLEEGYEFAQLELARHAMPTAKDSSAKNQDRWGGREVLLFIKMPKNGRRAVKVASNYITQQYFGEGQLVTNIMRECMLGRTSGMIVTEHFGQPRTREHEWSTMSDRARVRWVAAIIDIIIEGARGFSAQVFEEVRASLSLRDGKDVMELILKTLGNQATALKAKIKTGTPQNDYEWQLSALKDASHYVADRLCGVANYLETVRKWKRDDLESHEVLGKNVQRPRRLPLPNRMVKIQNDNLREGAASTGGNGLKSPPGQPSKQILRERYGQNQLTKEETEAMYARRAKMLAEQHALNLIALAAGEEFAGRFMYKDVENKKSLIKGQHGLKKARPPISPRQREWRDIIPTSRPGRGTQRGGAADNFTKEGQDKKHEEHKDGEMTLLQKIHAGILPPSAATDGRSHATDVDEVQRLHAAKNNKLFALQTKQAETKKQADGLTALIAEAKAFLDEEESDVEMGSSDIEELDIGKKTLVKYDFKQQLPSRVTNPLRMPPTDPRYQKTADVRMAGTPESMVNDSGSESLSSYHSADGRLPDSPGLAAALRAVEKMRKDEDDETIDGDDVNERDEKSGDEAMDLDDEVAAGGEVAPMEPRG